MQEREDTRSRRPEGNAQSQSTNDATGEPSSESSLLDLMTAMVILIRQTWADRWSLFKAEARLVAKGLALILLVSILLALTAMLIWVLLLGVVSYLAWQAGIHWGWIAGGVFAAQGVLLLYLRGQLRRLLIWLRFPETRKAFGRLPDRQPSSPNSASQDTPST